MLLYYPWRWSAYCLACIIIISLYNVLHVYTIPTTTRTCTPSEEDRGEGLKVLVTFRPDNCQHKAKTGDVIHYHYVGRLGSNGQEFGKR